MKVLLVAINAKYIHSNLAVHSIAAFAKEKLNAKDGCEIEIAEYTINQPINKIMTDIYEKQADIIMFSCYIWNINHVEQLVDDLNKVMPDTDIWLGGPEVSFDGVQRAGSGSIKGVICGEGEEAFVEIMENYLAGEEPETVKIKSSTMDMDKLLFPYVDMEAFDNRIIYYESSRGCPFRCSYCLSSIDKVLRFRDEALVKRELKFFLDKNVPQVKFIDRTFNCDKARTKEIWEFIQNNDNGITNFHFEIAGDLLDDELIELMSKLRPGQIQLEIGVQSTNERTLKEINRPMSFEKLAKVVKRIKSSSNVHLHLDLIAGLPYEDMQSFRQSFDDVFSLQPEEVQLGFLKVLKGTPMAEKCEEYQMVYSSMAPYEVLKNKWISYDELLKLKEIEEMVEIYYNSGQFANSLGILLRCFDRPIELFESLASWYKENNLQMLNFSRNRRYEALFEFGYGIMGNSSEKLMDALIMDFYLRENVKSRPDFLRMDEVEKSFAKEFYSVEAREHRVLKGGSYDVDDPRKLRNMTHIEKITGKYYLFDYENRSPMNNNAEIVEIGKK